MKRVMVKSVFEAFDYVMDHYYPAGLEEMAERKDDYVVISIQDTHTDGFGFEFKESLRCRGVLTLYFDDVMRPVDEAVAFSEEMARSVIAFIDLHRDVESLLVHCYGGQSRSRAVAAFAVKRLGGNNDKYFQSGNPNILVYNTLIETGRKLDEGEENV